MKQFHIPYKKGIHYVILGFFGIPLLVFIYSYFMNEEKVESSLRGILWYTWPTVLTALLLLPQFTFKSTEKVSEDKAVLKLPMIELWLWIVWGISLLYLFGGITSYLDPNPTKLDNMIIYSLPVIVLCFFMLNSNKVLFKGEYITERDKRAWEKRKNSTGFFTYSRTGFRFKDKKTDFSCEWGDIESILAYKKDLFTVDRICLQIQKSAGDFLNIHEDIDGFFVFKEQMHANMPGIHRNWELGVMDPAFELSPTWVYKKTDGIGENPHE